MTITKTLNLGLGLMIASFLAAGLLVYFGLDYGAYLALGLGIIVGVAIASSLVPKVGVTVETAERLESLTRAQSLKIADYSGQLEAIDKSQAVIEFQLDGTIVTANDNFLNALGYTLDEIRGKHHSMFVDPKYARSVEYREFWERLNRGEYQTGQFKRIGKEGRVVWLQASYKPILIDGKATKVVKYADDITEQTLRNANYAGQIEAINSSQAVAEFELDGTIRSANDNFLNAFGYRLEEIQGKPHRILVDAEYGRSAKYNEFWERLRQGEYQAGEFKRIGKDGQRVWLRASYRPILIEGKPLKVVNYGDDITARKLAVAEMVEAAAATSQGDLSKPGLTESDDDMGKIATSFNAMVASLRKIMTDTQNTTEQVSTATVEISTAAQQQLTSLNETVSALNEVASTAEEFKTTIQEFADRAQSVQDATGETASQAREGREAAQKSAEETEAVRDDIRAAGESVLHFANQMQRITEITNMVNEIAEQTKLLALNASIEAARAGEEGKGFAVVATQVRELATQSKEAARNISTLIADTQRSLQAVVNRIEQGTRQSDETAKTVRSMADQFEEFVEAFTQTADAMTQITGAAQQQEKGIVELVGGLAQIETASKETLTSAEQTQKSIAEIDRQTATLNANMQKFKV